MQPWAKVFLEQDLEFLEEPVSQKQWLFSGLEIQDQSQMENDNVASEPRGFQLPENKNRSDAFTAKFFSQSKIAAGFCVSRTPQLPTFSFSQAFPKQLQ